MVTKLCFSVNGLRLNQFDPMEDVHDENILTTISQFMASGASLRQTIRQIRNSKLKTRVRERDFQDALLKDKRLAFDAHLINQLTETWLDENLCKETSKGLKVK